ncbi:hypothetical protein MMC13_004534 [Lambiella insularis]|nr:hypothetical protein [Lambiella insularis]
MPSSDNTSQPIKSRQDEDNPFIVFRRFADQQVANLLHNFIGLPSAITSHPSSARWRPYDDEVRRRRRDAEDYSSQNEADRDDTRLARDSPNYFHGRPYRSATEEDANTERAATKGELSGRTSASRQNNDEGDGEPMKCPYRPSERQLSKSHGTESSAGSWPYGYIMFSPYSPLCLKESFQEHGLWMDAFKDLLSYEEKKESPCEMDHPQHIFDSLCIQVAEDPSLALTIESLLDKFRSTTEGLGSRHLENDKEKEDTTELDFYERVFEKQRSDREAQSLASRGSHKFATEPEPKLAVGTTLSKESRPLGIISTLTTTERVALPDGTVHTKVVLKKRFADGREESSETLHTTQGGFQAQEPSFTNSPAPSTDAKPESERLCKGKNKAEKKGWFWS